MKSKHTCVQQIQRSKEGHCHRDGGWRHMGFVCVCNKKKLKERRETDRMKYKDQEAVCMDIALCACPPLKSQWLECGGAVTAVQRTDKWTYTQTHTMLNERSYRRGQADASSTWLDLTVWVWQHWRESFLNVSEAKALTHTQTHTESVVIHCDRHICSCRTKIC